MATPWNVPTGPNADQIRDDGLWRTLQANSIKTALRIAGVIDIVTTLALIVFWLFDRTPFIPPAVLEYAIIYNILHVGSGVLALIASGSRVDAIFAIVVVYCVPVLVLDLWAVITLIIWFIGCLVGSPVTFFTNCVLDALTRFVILVLALILFLVAIWIFAKALEMVRYLAYQRRANGIQRVQDNKGYKAQ